MNTFQLKIASPDGNIFKDQAAKISLRGSEGDLAVMAGHIPFITTVKSGACKIELEDGSTKTGYVESGLLTVSDHAVTLLSSNFQWET